MKLNIKAIIFDLDGVVYFGNEPAEGIVETIESIRQMGLSVFFITNNSAKSRKEIITKLINIGISVALPEVITSGYATVRYLKQIGAKHIFVLGTDELKKEFELQNLSLVDKPPCDYLVIGYDRKFDFEKLTIGLDILLSGAKFIACNCVPNFPVENGRIIPGLGAIIGALEVAAERKPDILIGKPNIFMLQELAIEQKLQPKEILFVGDSPKIDIRMANKFGAISVLITKQLEEYVTDIDKPIFNIEKICELFPLIKEIT